MAQVRETRITLIDDFDGSAAAETVTFELDGKTYEIDLSKSNANELRRTLKPYIDRSRPVRKSPSKRRGTTTAAARGTRRPEGYDRTEVRAWAKANRVKVSPRGRISNDVVERWRKATGNATARRS